MINSRSLAELHPRVATLARALIARCEKEDIDLLVTSTYRDKDAQSALYARGRSQPGKIVTHAKPGQSFHNWRVAFDVVPLRYGKPVWGTTGKDLALWQRVGALGEAVGLEWGGRWTRPRDYPHFQFTGGLTLADFQTGRTLP